MNAERSTSKLQVLAYQRLSGYFQLHDNNVLEIEILPPAIEPPDGFFLAEGRSIGIPKKILALAYIEARKLFFEKIHEEKSRSDALAATKIMLLFDPEHLTAGNFRKRHLIRLKNDCSLEAHVTYREAVKDEFCFLDSILTSPLHRQSKSPNLWHHRLWLLDCQIPSWIGYVNEEQRVTFWQTELEAVCKSGEQHPKNYYAWLYARSLLAQIDGQDAVYDFAQHVKDWCCQHPSDISGWTFLACTLSRITSDQRKQEFTRDVLSYAIKLQLRNESLWVFMRLILAHDSLLEEHAQIEFINILQEASGTRSENNSPSIFHENIKRTLEWVNEHCEHNITGYSQREID